MKALDFSNPHYPVGRAVIINPTYVVAAEFDHTRRSDAVNPGMRMWRVYVGRSLEYVIDERVAERLAPFIGGE